MLETLSGRTHEVVSGLCLRTPAWEELARETTCVTFRALTPRELAHYLASGEWEGRAGALRDPGPRREPRRADRGRLPERRRPAGRAARAAARRALPRRRTASARRAQQRDAAEDERSSPRRGGRATSLGEQPAGEQRRDHDRRRAHREHRRGRAVRAARAGRARTSRRSRRGRDAVARRSSRRIGPRPTSGG